MVLANAIIRIYLFSLLALFSGIHAKLFPPTGQLVTQSEDNLNHEVKTGIEFPYHGSRYTSLFVSKDGLVGFKPSTLYRAEDFSKQVTKSDPAFVAPFYFDAHDIASPINRAPYTGQTLYRYTGGSGLSNVQQQELNDFSTIIKNSVVGIDEFKASFALVVTWKDVISRKDVEIGCKLGSGKICETNTFQLAMITDGSKSFAIFNYKDMNIAVHRYFQAGFNAGEGRGYTTAIQQADLGRAHTKYGSDDKGRYIYRIDEELIVKGGCSDNTSGELSISPKYAGMYGGRMIDISGPCLFTFSETPIIKCRFGGDNQAISYGFQVNAMKMRCYVPTMSTRGWMKMELSLNNGSYLYGTDILLVDPSRLNKTESLSLPYVGPGQGWNETNPEQLTIKWNSTLLTNDKNAHINVSLIGYRETSKEIIWQPLHNFGIARVSDEQLVFDTTNMCVGNVCDQFEIGLVKAELINLEKASHFRFLVSGSVSLGFYINDAMHKQYGADWASQKCKKWHDWDKTFSRWLQNVQHCPCTLVQALSDIGNFQGYAGCSIYHGSKCNLHWGSVHCVRSITPTKDGAGNQCCYDHDGNLRHSADSNGGSTPDRSHTWGALPYGREILVPGMSHFLIDVAPIFLCCVWTDYKDCDYYMDLRQTTDCSAYNPPTPAFIYGQGHMETFDGYHHRMCGEGDFVLMKTMTSDTESITVQGRFYRNELGNRGNSSVVLTNIAVRVGTEKVEIRLDLPSTKSSRRHLDVLINQQYHLFETPESKWQDFEKFAVFNSDTQRNEANFTIVLQNGLGIQVADCNLTLCVLIMAPITLKGKVDGLLGNFNGNPNDDLLSTDPSINRQRSNYLKNPLKNYQYFQYGWNVNKSNTIMPMNVIPNYDSSICSLQQQTKVLPGCHGNQECLFDYSSTGNAEIAIQTLKMYQRNQELRTFVQPVRTCGLLDVPRSIKNSTNYRLGSTVTVQSCRVGTKEGDAFTYTCTATGSTTQQWSPSVTATCTTEVESAQVGLIVGIIVGVVVFICIIVAFIIVIKRLRTSPNEKSEYKLAATKETDDNVNAEKQIEPDPTA